MSEKTPAMENCPGSQAPNHDDSGIGLDDDSMLMSVGKYDIMTDTTDAEGDVVVVA
jgi:regulatory factor X